MKSFGENLKTIFQAPHASGDDFTRYKATMSLSFVEPMIASKRFLANATHRAYTHR
jgi:hypothetical protein